MTKLFAIFIVLTVLAFGLVLAQSQNGTTSPPSMQSSQSGDQNLRGAPCRGPPLVNQNRRSAFQATTQAK